MHKLATLLLGAVGLLLVAAGVGFSVADLVAPGPGYLAAGLVLIGGAELAEWAHDRVRGPE